MFSIKSRVEFDSAHFLNNSNTPCDVLHGHRWKVDVTLKSENLNKVGFMVNFTELKSWMKEMTENIDHNLAVFYLKDSTAEHFALYFFMFIAEKVHDYNKKNKTNIEVERVDVAETPNNIASFKIADLDIRKERIRRATIKRWADPEERKKLMDGIQLANQDPILREMRSIRMQVGNPMSRRDVVDKILHSLVKSQKKYPNKEEKMIGQFFRDNNIPLTYCGDGSFILMGKIPDFVNIEKKVVVEYNGRFWHSENEWNDAYDDSKERIEHFAKYGYTCYIIWDDEFDAKKDEIIKDLKKLCE